MKRQNLQIAKPLRIDVVWYDRLTEPIREELHPQCEVIGWHDGSVVVRIPGYAVLKFWKKNGFEVGNPDKNRRGWRVDLANLDESVKPPKGVEVNLPE